MKRPKVRNKYLPIIILSLFGVLMFFMGIMNHYYFRTFVFDYGNYNFAFWDYSHFRISPMPTYSGNFLQDHYSFLLFYFVPLYWLFNWLTGTYTLILLQNALIVLSAWYSYKFIKLKSDNQYLHIGIIFYYFLLLGRYSTFSGDVNLAVMSACFIPVFLYYFEIEKYLTASILLILLLFSRENIPLWFIFIFIVLIIDHWEDKKAVRLCLWGIIISIVYFVILFKVLIPSVENSDKQFTLFNYSALGPDPFTAVKYIIYHPIETVKLLFVNHLDNPRFDGIKIEFYLVYLISGGFILFYRPKYLIWFIPIVAQKVLNDAPIRWGIVTYYSIEVVTLLPISVFLTLSKIKSIKTQNILVLITCILTLSVTIHKMNRSNRVMPDRFRPDKEKFYSKEFYQTEYDLNEVHKLLNKIPKNAKVSASNDFFPHLSQRFNIYLFPEVADAEYVIISDIDNYFDLSHMENEIARVKIKKSNTWELVDSSHPVHLYKRNYQTNLNDYLTNYQSDTIRCNFEKFDNQDVLFNNYRKADSKNNLSNKVAFSERNSLLLNRQNPYGYAIKFDNYDNIKYIKASVWVNGDIKNSFIVAKFPVRKSINSNYITETTENGWSKIELAFSILHNENSNLYIHLWNGGGNEVYFDDFQIIVYCENN